VHFGVILPNYGTGSSPDGIRRLADLNAAGAKAAALEENVTDEAAVDALVAQIVERFGRLEVLVNNAGIEKSQPLLEIDESSWDRTLAVDLKGPFLCLQAAARRMKESGGGSIVNISFHPRGLPVPELHALRGSEGRAVHADAKRRARARVARDPGQQHRARRDRGADQRGHAGGSGEGSAAPRDRAAPADGKARRGGRGRVLSRIRPVVVRDRLDLLRRHYTRGFALEEVAT
jgi:hypothetical protein